MYVLTVTPEPAAALREAVRVIRRGGEIIVVSRISPEAPVLVALEKWRTCGWSSDALSGPSACSRLPAFNGRGEEGDLR